MEAARVEEAREQRHDGQLGQAEAEDAGAEGDDGPEDDALLLVRRQEVEVAPIAQLDGDGGEGRG